MSSSLTSAEMDQDATSFDIPPEHAEQTLAAVLRARLPGQSWSQVRRLIDSRRVEVNGEVCVDPARRLQAGESVNIRTQPQAPPREREALTIRHHDVHLVVVEKPSGLSTVRHP